MVGILTIEFTLMTNLFAFLLVDIKFNKYNLDWTICSLTYEAKSTHSPKLKSLGTWEPRTLLGSTGISIGR